MLDIPLCHVYNPIMSLSLVTDPRPAGPRNLRYFPRLSDFTAVSHQRPVTMARSQHLLLTVVLWCTAGGEIYLLCLKLESLN